MEQRSSGENNIPVRKLYHTRNASLQRTGGLLQQAQASEGILFSGPQALRHMHSAPQLCTSATMENTESVPRKVLA